MVTSWSPPFPQKNSTARPLPKIWKLKSLEVDQPGHLFFHRLVVTSFTTSFFNYVRPLSSSKTIPNHHYFKYTSYYDQISLEIHRSIICLFCFCLFFGWCERLYGQQGCLGVLKIACDLRGQDTYPPWNATAPNSTWNTRVGSEEFLLGFNSHFARSVGCYFLRVVSKLGELQPQGTRFSRNFRVKKWSFHPTCWLKKTTRSPETNSNPKAQLDYLLCSWWSRDKKHPSTFDFQRGLKKNEVSGSRTSSPPHYLEDGLPVSKWLITMVIVSPLNGVKHPFQMAFLWLIQYINRGY